LFSNVKVSETLFWGWDGFCSNLKDPGTVEGPTTEAVLLRDPDNSLSRTCFFLISTQQDLKGNFQYYSKKKKNVTSKPDTYRLRRYSVCDHDDSYALLKGSANRRCFFIRDFHQGIEARSVTKELQTFWSFNPDQLFLLSTAYISD
jgi:hypothetical protein